MKGKIKSIQLDKQKWGVGLDFYVYQIDLGFRLKYWADIHTLALRVYLGPLRVWGYVKVR